MRVMEFQELPLTIQRSYEVGAKVGQGNTKSRVRDVPRGKRDPLIRIQRDRVDELEYRAKLKWNPRRSMVMNPKECRVRIRIMNKTMALTMIYRNK